MSYQTDVKYLCRPSVILSRHLYFGIGPILLRGSPWIAQGLIILVTHLTMKKGTFIGLSILVIASYGAAKNAPVLPQRPKFQEMLRSTLTRPNAENVGHVVETGLVVYEAVKRAALWLKGIKKKTVQKAEYLYDVESIADSPLSNDTTLANLMDEIQVCKPYGSPYAKCHSRCLPHKYYRYCWTSNQLEHGTWSTCTCQLRRTVKQYLAVVKDEMIEAYERLQRRNQLPVSPLEIVLIVFGLMSLIIIICLAASWNRNRADFANRLAAIQSSARGASCKASRRASQVSCALSRHMPRPSRPSTTKDAEVQANVDGNETEIK